MKESYLTKKEVDVYDKTSAELWDKMDSTYKEELLRNAKDFIDDNYKFIGEKE